MKILYYDCFAGISGDMHLGAMVDAGVDPEYLVSELAKLPLEGYRVNVCRDKRKGIEGTRVDILLDSEEKKPDPGRFGHDVSGESRGTSAPDDHAHEDHHHHEHQTGSPHSHAHEDHHHHAHQTGSPHSHAHEDHHHHAHQTGSPHSHAHVHRNIRDIEKILMGSKLEKSVKKRALNMFHLIARAEAAVHGLPVEKVHFHEVGAIDSIVDITGAALCLEYLKPDRILSSAVELGGGMVRCAHGMMPVPAPATAEILKGIPVRMGTTGHEATTPTGAAILAANVDEFTDRISFKPARTAYGIGQRDASLPNVLRVMLGEMDQESTAGIQQSIMVECNIDDMNPEFYDQVVDALFSQGARDVFLTPVIMKKGRPAITVSVLCDPEDERKITRYIFHHTTTFGVRTSPVAKQFLDRSTERVTTSLGEVQVKKVYLEGKFLKQKLEYEDCRALAEQHRLPLMEVYRRLNAEIFTK